MLPASGRGRAGPRRRRARWGRRSCGGSCALSPPPASGRRVIAASRIFVPSVTTGSRVRQAQQLIAVDLLDPASVAALPDCPYVLFLAGRKFGSTDDTPLTWATNTIVPGQCRPPLPARASSRFPPATCIRSFRCRQAARVESDVPSPRGEYAQSCLGRERVFEYYSREHGTPTLIFRLNYAVDLPVRRPRRHRACRQDRASRSTGRSAISM